MGSWATWQCEVIFCLCCFLVRGCQCQRRGKPLCFPRPLPSWHPPLLSPFSSSCTWDHPGRERVLNPTWEWKGRGGSAIFPRIWGFWLGFFFPTFIGGECNDRLTTCSLPHASSPWRSTGSQISSQRGRMAALSYIPLGTKEKEKLLSMRADGRLFPGSSAPVSFFLLSWQIRTRTHTPTEEQLSSWKNK